jgi:hypothetical protein
MGPHRDPSTMSCAIREASSADIDDGRQYVLVVEDLLAVEMDAFGPMTRAAAHIQAERTRADFETQGIAGVLIAVVPLRETPADSPKQGAAGG